MGPTSGRDAPTSCCRWPLGFGRAVDRHVAVRGARACCVRKRGGDFIAVGGSHVRRSEGGGGRHGGAACAGPSDAGSPVGRILAVGCGSGQRQKEDEARPPRKPAGTGGRRPYHTIASQKPPAQRREEKRRRGGALGVA
jgi:hypothetical protein